MNFNMVKQSVKVRIPVGVHFRPAGKITECAMKFNSKTTIKMGNREANVKSFLNLLAAGIKYDDEIEIICDGPDEQQALRELVNIFENEMNYE
jgi:phosphocarrier protein